MSPGSPLAGKVKRYPPFPYRPFVEVLEDRTVPSFVLGGSYAVGSYPTDVAVGDFNGDGIPDLVVANYHSDTVSFLLGKQDGTFLPAQNYPTGPGPISLAVADFNRDGKLDVAVGRYASDMVTILLGKGDGSFQDAQNYGADLRTLSLAVGDFNGDGLPDLAVGGYANVGLPQRVRGTLSILLGNGDGTFQAAHSFADGYPEFVTAVDLNGDGADDLVTSNAFRDRLGDYVEKEVRVLLGKGDGTFQEAQSYQDGSIPNSVAVSDFNGDGITDLAVASYVFRGPLMMTVLLGKGDGSFQPAYSHAVSFSADRMVVGDFNGDGKPDLAGVEGGANLLLLLGQGDGDFEDVQSYPAGVDFSALVVSDFNHDGLPDLALTDRGSNTVTILLNVADWWPAATLQVTSPASVVAGVPFDVSVTALDSYGHLATSFTGAVSFASTDPYPGVLPAAYTFTPSDHGVHTFTGVTLFTAGSQSLRVEDPTDPSLAGSATPAVSAARATDFLITAPSTAISGMSFDLTVTAVDPYGNVATSYTGTVAFASSDTAVGVVLPPDYVFQLDDQGSHTFSGIVTLITPGDQTVTATSTESGFNGTAAIAIVPGEPPPGGRAGAPCGWILSANRSRGLMGNPGFGFAFIDGFFEALMENEYSWARHFR